MYETNIKIIEQLIYLQKISLKQYIYYTAVIIGIGVSVIICGLIFFDRPETVIKHVITAGGSIITAYSGLSFKEFLNKKDNINLYLGFKNNLEIFRENTEKQKEFENLMENYFFKHISLNTK